MGQFLGSRVPVGAGDLIRIVVQTDDTSTAETGNLAGWATNTAAGVLQEVKIARESRRPCQENTLDEHTRTRWPLVRPSLSAR